MQQNHYFSFLLLYAYIPSPFHVISNLIQSTKLLQVFKIKIVISETDNSKVIELIYPTMDISYYGY